MKSASMWCPEIFLMWERSSQSWSCTESFLFVYDPTKNGEFCCITTVNTETMQVIFALLKKETFSMWDSGEWHLGHIWVVLWISGSNESTCVSHLQPCTSLCVLLRTYVQCTCQNFIMNDLQQSFSPPKFCAIL